MGHKWKASIAVIAAAADDAAGLEVVVVAVECFFFMMMTFLLRSRVPAVFAWLRIRWALLRFGFPWVPLLC